jgi:hypothetical protein
VLAIMQSMRAGQIFCKTLMGVRERIKINQACTGNGRRSRNFAL